MRINAGILLMGLLILMLSPFNSISYADGKYPVRIKEQSIYVFPTGEGSLQAIQIAVFENNGTEKEAQLPLNLPNGYSQLELREGLEDSKVNINEKGIIDLEGLEAGAEKRIAVSYFMPIDNKKSLWSIEQSYVTVTFNVAVLAGVLSLEAPKLVTQSEVFNINDLQFREFTRLNVHPDEPWTLSFRLLDQQMQNEYVKEKYTSDGKKIYGDGHESGFLKAVVTLIIILVAFTVALVGLKQDYSTKSKVGSRPWLLSEKKLLLQQIGNLEEDYTSQIISHESYSNAKKEIREKLIRIALELRGEQKQHGRA